MPQPFRKDGWYDRRYKITPDVERYIRDMTERKMMGQEAISFRWWSTNGNVDVADGNWIQP
jgi:hypothetical protein